MSSSRVAVPERILEYLLGRVSPEGPTRHFGAAHFGARRQPAAVFTAGGTRGRRALLRLRIKTSKPHPYFKDTPPITICHKTNMNEMW